MVYFCIKIYWWREYTLINPQLFFFLTLFVSNCQKCCDQFSCGISHEEWTAGGDRVLCLWAIDPALSAPFSFLGLCLLNWSTLSVISTTESSQFALNYHSAKKKKKEQEVRNSTFLHPFNNETQIRRVTSLSRHNMLKQLKVMWSDERRTLHFTKEKIFCGSWTCKQKSANNGKQAIDVLMNVIVSVLSLCV